LVTLRLQKRGVSKKKGDKTGTGGHTHTHTEREREKPPTVAAALRHRKNK
jgi:hypothetical protein